MMNNQLPTSDYFDYEDIRIVLNTLVFDVTPFGKRPHGIDWQFQRVSMFTRLTATQIHVDAGIVAGYVANRNELTGGYQLRAPVLLRIDGRLYIVNGHHRAVAAIQRGEQSLFCWVGYSREPP